MNSKRYASYLRKSFVRFAGFSLVFTALIFLIFLAASFHRDVARYADRAASRAARLIESEEARLTAVLDELERSNELQALFVDSASARDRRLAYEALYRIKSESGLALHFFIEDAEGEVLAEDLYTGEREAFLRDLERAGIGLDRDLERIDLSPIMTEVGPYRALYRRPISFGTAFRGSINLLAPAYDLRDLELQSHDAQIVVCDPYAQLIFQSQRPIRDDLDKYPRSKFPYQEIGPRLLRYNERIHYFTELKCNSIVVYCLVSLQTQLRLLRVAGLVFFLSLPLLLAFAFLFARRRVEALERPLADLYAAAKAWESGALDERLPNSEFEDFQTVYRAFNELIDSQLALIEKNQDLAESQRQLEVQQLKRQFQPHFLFNCLEAIRYQIRLDPPQASEMLRRLAALLRYSIRLETRPLLVALGEDLHYIEDYLALQKLRYEEGFSYSIDLDKGLEAEEVPKLLLQPLVENALIHGLRNGEAMHLSIRGGLTNSELYLEVADTGAGLGLDALLTLKNRLANDSDTKSSEHLGLYYVQHLLKLLYGKAGKLNLARGENGRGFVARIEIPRSKCIYMP
ncbi:MAG: histidine kinase [Eubacteriales bacterium]|nr:histidine kinase [Eubacteriales bacterium]